MTKTKEKPQTIAEMFSDLSGRIVNDKELREKLIELQRQNTNGIYDGPVRFVREMLDTAFPFLNQNPEQIADRIMAELQKKKISSIYSYIDSSQAVAYAKAGEKFGNDGIKEILSLDPGMHFSEALTCLQAAHEKKWNEKDRFGDTGRRLLRDALHEVTYRRGGKEGLISLSLHHFKSAQKPFAAYSDRVRKFYQYRPKFKFGPKK